MEMSGNTILVTGGGSGIGRGLAEAFHAAGNHVIIAGRRADVLQEVAAAHPGMASLVLDMADPAAITALAHTAKRDFPALNVLVNNAGIIESEDVLAEPFDLAACEATVATNLLGPIRLTMALLPQLRAQPMAAVINVTSGLAFVPGARAPTYCATKAALHSYTQSLRFQLRQTAVQVIELAPPLVATPASAGERDNPRMMPIDDFVGEVMALLASQPAAPEILVERVKFLRHAEAQGNYDKVFAAINAG